MLVKYLFILIGVPGFSFIIANLKKFGSCEGWLL